MACKHEWETQFTGTGRSFSETQERCKLCFLTRTTGNERTRGCSHRFMYNPTRNNLAGDWQCTKCGARSYEHRYSFE